MSYAGVQMKSLSMMVPVHIFNPWCKCPLVGMPWCECFDANTIYSKIPFVFKIKASSASETKIFSNLDLLFFEKSSSFFLLKALEENWWSLLEISGWDINSKIWRSGSKDLFFHNLVEQRGAMFPRSFSRKTNSLKFKHLKKIHFF